MTFAYNFLVQAIAVFFPMGKTYGYISSQIFKAKVKYAGTNNSIYIVIAVDHDAFPVFNAFLDSLNGNFHILKKPGGMVFSEFVLQIQVSMFGDSIKKG